MDKDKKGNSEKGWWRRFLERLVKANRESALSGCRG